MLEGVSSKGLPAESQHGRKPHVETREVGEQSALSQKEQLTPSQARTAVHSHKQSRERRHLEDCHDNCIQHEVGTCKPPHMTHKQQHEDALT